MSEEFRRQTEAREWLRRTNGDPQRIKELLKRIEAKRGKEAAEVLRADMREQYRRARFGAGQQSMAL
jgi:hypothetical protein